MVSDADLLWHLGRRYARQALYWYREYVASDPGDDLWTAGDTAAAVWTWLYWHIGDPRDPASLERIGTQDHAPPSIPRQASAWERQLLTPLVGAGPGDEDWERTCAAVISLVVRWMVRAKNDGDPDAGQILTSVEVADPVNLDLAAGGTRAVACPVCRRDRGLRWQWDGMCARVVCPQGHAEWTPVAGDGLPMRATDWELITSTPAEAPDEVEAPEEPEPSMGEVETHRALLTAQFGPELGAQLHNAQLRSIYYANLLICAVFDHNPHRVQHLLTEVMDSPAEAGLAFATASTIAKHHDGLAQITPRVPYRPAPAQLRHAAQTLLAAAAPEPLRGDALALLDTAMDRAHMSVLAPQAPSDSHRAQAEMTVLAARTAAWLGIGEIFSAPHVVLYGMASGARIYAREAGLLPPHARVAVSERDARVLLTTWFGRDRIAAIPPLGRRSPTERDMISLARRHLLDGDPDEDLRSAILTLIEGDLAEIDAARAQARKDPAARNEQSRRGATDRRQPKKTSRRKRKN